MPKRKKRLFLPALKPVFTFASQCMRKVRFTSKEADEVALRFRQRKYKCMHCSGFHLTSDLQGH